MVARRDFFGRLVQPALSTLSPASSSSSFSFIKNTTVAGKQQPEIFFRYQEGFSNAVRKPLKLKDFLSILNNSTIAP